MMDHAFFNDPAMVEYFLKTKFSVYDKGPVFRTRAQDTFGHGIFNIDGDSRSRKASSQPTSSMSRTSRTS
ncbi:hypothetical protein BC830DRAFT_1102504 [Chytriomyces sp. MP71]|nr:hypothetical protein BC830DRAFT_1102504 [Chytriomyces sp. MP71]